MTGNSIYAVLLVVLAGVAACQSKPGSPLATVALPSAATPSPTTVSHGPIVE